MKYKLLKRINPRDPDNSTSMGYTFKTLSVGLWAYFNCRSFEEGLNVIVHEGGDADTNAAVACSIPGAKSDSTIFPNSMSMNCCGKTNCL
jgi:ADP-ribosylglycohydrolase